MKRVMNLVFMLCFVLITGCSSDAVEQDTGIDESQGFAFAVHTEEYQSTIVARLGEQEHEFIVASTDPVEIETLLSARYGIYKDKVSAATTYN